MKLGTLVTGRHKTKRWGMSLKSIAAPCGELRQKVGKLEALKVCVVNDDLLSSIHGCRRAARGSRYECCQHPSPALCLGRRIHIRTSMNLSAEEGERNVRRSVDHVNAVSSGNEKLGADSPQSQ